MDRPERAGGSSVQSVAMWKYACFSCPGSSPRFLGSQEGRELKRTKRIAERTEMVGSLLLGDSP